MTIPDDPAAVDDLRARLRSTRWPDDAGVDGWDLGADVAYLRDLVDYWADGFDWSAQVARQNRLRHERVELDGLGIHVIRAAGIGPRPVPLLLCHGWPDATWRYEKVLPLLTDPGAHGGDPADAFDLVVPDMPGFGYSAIPSRPSTRGPSPRSGRSS